MAATAASPRLSRRAFLRGEVRAQPPVPRPPWARIETEFLQACNACGDCLTACPEHVLVRDADGRARFDPQRGECTFCGDCATACTTGAIDRLRVPRAWDWIADIADDCLAHRGVVCSSCRDACAETALHFAPVAAGVPAPRLDPQRCTGCGACVGACPVSAISLALPQVAHD